jgi:hypothetical protein
MMPSCKCPITCRFYLLHLKMTVTDFNGKVHAPEPLKACACGVPMQIARFGPSSATQGDLGEERGRKGKRGKEHFFPFLPLHSGPSPKSP